MYRRKQERHAGFGKAILIFSLSLAGVLAIGLAMSGVFGDGEDGSSLAQNEVMVPAVQNPRQSDTVKESMESTEIVTKIPLESPVAIQIPTVSYSEAESAFLQKDYKEALDLFTFYTEQHPGNAWGHYMLGLSAWKAGYPDDAENGFQNALRLDPRHLKSTLNLARVLLDDDRPGEALTVCLEATRLDTTRGETYRLIGRAHHNLGQVDEAVTAYRRAITLDVEDAWAMNNLGLLLIETGRFDEAIFPLAGAVKTQPDKVIFQNNLGIALERTGHFEAAAEAYRAALVVDDTNEKVLANLTRVDPLTDSPETMPVALGELASRFLGTLREVKETTDPLVSEAQPETQNQH